MTSAPTLSCPLVKQALRATCPARKSTCPMLLDGTFFSPCDDDDDGDDDNE